MIANDDVIVFVVAADGDGDNAIYENYEDYVDSRDTIKKIRNNDGDDDEDDDNVDDGCKEPL